MCGAEPPFVKVMTCPVLAVMAAGWNSKSMIVTATAPASLVSLQTWAPAADGAAADGAAADAAFAGATEAAVEAVLEEHAARMNTAAMASVASERCDIGPSLSISTLQYRRVRHRCRSGFAPAIVSQMITPTAGPGPGRPLDAAAMRRLLVHEARIHAVPGREFRDLGDAFLLHDPGEVEPFWNRLQAVRWPAEPSAFDRRLTEILVLFASIGRQAHIWASPLHDSPDDLVARLTANGFRLVGLGGVMLLADPGPSLLAASHPFPADVTVERLSRLAGPAAKAAATGVVDVLLDAFDVGDERRDGIEGETVVTLGHPWFTHYLARVDGVPAAVARRATFDGASYLSSIGTAVWARGRGLGSLVTRIAGADAVTAGSDWTYLGVVADNLGAIRVYERSGYERVGESAADLLLV